jgi:hypothetical protein
MRVFELATWHGRGGLDNGPSKSAADTAEQVAGTALWTGRTWVKWQLHGGRMWVKWQHHGGRTWEHNWGALQAAEIVGSCPITCWKISH